MLEFSNNKGFSLIEILLVIVIIAILASVAIPGYLGITERGRVSAVTRAASSATTELSYWLQTSISSESARRSVDSNFDGKIDGSDLTNSQLLSAGVAVTYASGKTAFVHESSPWFSGTPLWTNDGSLPNGQITLVQQSVTSIRMCAKNKTGNIIFQKMISVD